MVYNDYVLRPSFLIGALDWRRIVVLTVLISILVFATYQYYMLAYRLTILEEERHGKGYVSDEVWYVPSARNVLRRITNTIPVLPGGRYGASIIYEGSIELKWVRVVARRYHVRIVDDSYSQINAFYVESNNLSNIKLFIENISSYYNISDVVYGWRIPDAHGINEYLNTEHPPLVKYLIALSIMFLGDYPLYWRIPSIIAGVLTILFTFLAVKELTCNPWLGLVTALIASIDPIMRYMSSIALLDIFVALFTIVAFYVAVKGRYWLSLVIVLIGSTAKFNTLFALIPIYLLILRRELKKDKSIVNFIYVSVVFLLVTIILFFIFQIIVSIPLINMLGFESWLSQSIFGAIKWHTSIKCTGPACPVSSAPWDWFFGNKGFVLYYVSTEEKLVALGYWPLWVISFISSFFLIPAYRYDKRFGYTWLFLQGIFWGYVLLWLKGGRTQYSFYSVQFAPFIYSFLIVMIVYIVFNRRNMFRIYRDWYLLGKYIWSIIVQIITW
jgi:predicted membrane-bound dolichyl-phosphate-mannose-protein mannosyltransferase